MTLRTKHEEAKDGVLQEDRQNTLMKALTKEISNFKQTGYLGSRQKVKVKRNTKKVCGTAFALKSMGK